MKKIFILLSIIFMIGCSQKTVYPQLEGGLVQPSPKKTTYLNKKVYLKKLDKVANEIFNELYIKEKKLQESEFNEKLKNIYRQGF